MEKGQVITDEELKKQGLHHLLNYGNWEVWANNELRIYREIKTDIIKEIYKGDVRRPV